MEVETVLAKAKPTWRRAVAVLIYTGLRRSDAAELRRSDIDGGFIEVMTSKTKAKVCIPIHGRLAEELARPLPVESVFLIAGQRGQQLKPGSITQGIQRECRRIGIENPPPIHGLRKNAVMMLREVGCTDDEIHAITGQSKEMIKLYGEDYDRRKLASAAVVKINQNRQKENGS